MIMNHLLPSSMKSRASYDECPSSTQIWESQTCLRGEHRCSRCLMNEYLKVQLARGGSLRLINWLAHMRKQRPPIPSHRRLQRYSFMQRQSINQLYPRIPDRTKEAMLLDTASSLPAERLLSCMWATEAWHVPGDAWCWSGAPLA